MVHGLWWIRKLFESLIRRFKQTPYLPKPCTVNIVFNRILGPLIFDCLFMLLLWEVYFSGHILAELFYFELWSTFPHHTACPCRFFSHIIIPAKCTANVFCTLKAFIPFRRECSLKVVATRFFKPFPLVRCQKRHFLATLSSLCAQQVIEFPSILSEVAGICFVVLGSDHPFATRSLLDSRSGKIDITKYYRYISEWFTPSIYKLSIFSTRSKPLIVIHPLHTLEETTCSHSLISTTEKERTWIIFQTVSLHKMDERWLEWVTIKMNERASGPLRAWTRFEKINLLSRDARAQGV